MSSAQQKDKIINKKQKYREFCRSQHNLPIFFHSEWLDITTFHGSWDVSIVADNAGEVIGCLPYFITKKYGQQAILMPPLTPYGGIFIAQNNASKLETYTKNEKEIIAELIDALPKHIVYYSQSFYYTFTNWLPFYWRKYQQTTRYSFIIDDIRLWSLGDVATNIRNKIRKAQNELSIIYLDNPTIIYNQVSEVLKNKGINLMLSFDTFTKLDEWLNSQNKRLIIGAKDETGKIHACIYLIFDLDKAYCMLIGSDIHSRKNGAIPFLLYNAILESNKRVKTFDFEGSMLESLFDLFAGFGGKMTPYYRIYKAKNIFWDIAYRIKSYYDNHNR
jgi:hypothetical protein